MSQAQVLRGDCLQILKTLPAGSVDSIVTDPPYGLSDEPDIVEVLKHWIAGDRYEHGSSGFMGKCFHPDTDILTVDGWRKVAEVGLTDRVCSLNPSTGEIEFVPVVETHAYDYEGDLLMVGGRSAAQLVTPNHNVWTEKGLVEAAKLPSSFKLFNQGKWRGQDRPVDLAGRRWNGPAFFKFVGLWLGDGYVATRQNQPEKQDFIGFSVHKSRKVEAIRSCLAKLEVKFTETANEQIGRVTFYVYDAALREFLRPLGKALTKHVPSELFSFGADLLSHLYDGLMETDGCVQGEGQHVFSTSSARLANDFQTLCLLLGRSGTLSVHKEAGQYEIEGRTGAHATSYRVSVVREGAEFHMLRDGRVRPGRSGQPPSVSTVPYAGQVFCITLERNHVLMSRWDGRPVWSGNSWDSFVPGPEYWTECFRVLKPGGHLLAFGGTRTFDMQTIAIRMAGFEIRDSILAWVYGQGFPKSLDVSKAIDKSGGVEAAAFKAYLRAVVERSGMTRKAIDEACGFVMRFDTPFADDPIGWGVSLPSPEKWEVICRVLGENPSRWSALVHRVWRGRAGPKLSGNGAMSGPNYERTSKGDAVIDAAIRWRGWGTALKPSHEPIVLARKPLVSTVSANVLTYGTGALNIDACRIGLKDGEENPSIGRYEKWLESPEEARSGVVAGGWEHHNRGGRFDEQAAESMAKGRWPPNLILAHSPSCVRTGTTKVEARVINRFDDGMKPFGDGAGHEFTTVKTSEDGTEEIAVYECAGDCPVAALDQQSGISKSTGGVNAGGLGDRVFGSFAKDRTGASAGGFGDEGGASRFFEQVELSEWDCAPECPVAALDAQSGTLTSGRLDRSKIVAENKTYGARPKDLHGTYEPDSGGASRFFEQVELGEWDCAPECPVAALDAQSGPLRSGERPAKREGLGFTGGASGTEGDREVLDNGGASRFFEQVEIDPDLDPPFFYTAKVAKKERNLGGVENKHPTLKPVRLLRWLVRLVTPPGGVVLDPFCGSGSTGVAAVLEGFDFIGIELQPEYADVAEKRIAFASEHPEDAKKVTEPSKKKSVRQVLEEIADEIEKEGK